MLRPISLYLGSILRYRYILEVAMRFSEGKIMVSVNALFGKNVVGEEAIIIGESTGAQIDLPRWLITHIQVKLTDEVTRELGYKKPFLGSVEVLLPVGFVKAVGDIISVNKSIKELKNIFEPRK